MEKERNEEGGPFVLQYLFVPQFQLFAAMQREVIRLSREDPEVGAAVAEEVKPGFMRR